MFICNYLKLILQALHAQTTVQKLFFPDLNELRSVIISETKINHGVKQEG